MTCEPIDHLLIKAITLSLTDDIPTSNEFTSFNCKTLLRNVITPYCFTSSDS